MFLLEPMSVEKQESVGGKQAQKSSSEQWIHENWQNAFQSSREMTVQMSIHIKRKCKDHKI